MDKNLILKLLLEKAEMERDKAKSAYELVHGHATEPELKADGKYDTRATEAGYLAGAQKRRLDELEQEVALIQEIDTDANGSIVSVGSVVLLETMKQKRWYFISSTSGGTMLTVNNEVVLVVTAFSPIGSAVIGLAPDDEFEIETQNGSRTFRVIEHH
jgi:transcription elongation GreA/GreB family factor